MSRHHRFTILPLAFAIFSVGCDSAPVAPGETDEVGSLALNHVKGGPTTAKANLHPSNQSAVKAKVTFTDDGSTLTVDGTATGLIPGVTYGSLIYDVSSLPGGPIACLPTIFDPTDPNFIIPTMFVGIWTNNGDGTGTLSATNTNGGADYVPLSKIRTISIRNFDVASVENADLVACGVVATHAER